ncbi:MAG: glycoside hydrolase family 172 protein, partial [Verrucomicrobiota bacterium]
FGNAFYSREYSSIPISHLDGAYICQFPMPFANGMKAEITHDGAEPIQLETGHRISSGSSTNLNYFHARWNDMHSEKNKKAPYPFLATSGKGHYVGCYLDTIAMETQWRILEGDESIYVDGETKPSWQGTGLEDYFNGAWYYSGIFDQPLHGLVEKAPIKTGQYRWHISDRIAFDSNYQMDFEFGENNEAQGYISSVAYWYQNAPVSVKGSVPELAKRYPKKDPLEEACIMGQLFELERIDHFAEAAERCRIYAERYAGNSYAGVMKLRSIAYREKLEGYEAVKPAYEKFITKNANDPSVDDAKKLMWFHEDPQNALLGLYVEGNYTVYINRVKVVPQDKTKQQETGNGQLNAVQLKLNPGEHEMLVAITP